METEIMYKYWPCGRLGSECSVIKYKKTRHGLQKYYYESGNSRMQLNCMYGQEVGLQQSWNPNKTRSDLTQAKNNTVHGIDIGFKY